MNATLTSIQPLIRRAAAGPSILSRVGWRWLAVLLLGLATTAVQAQSVTVNGPAGSRAFGTSVTVLPNGNYVVTDPLRDNAGATSAGAVYLYNGRTHALLSTLTGTTANDQVGGGGITVLTNGNYVVRSPGWDNGPAQEAGAATWCSGTTGLSGAVSATNSFVGGTGGDRLGFIGITALTNGNYVVVSNRWGNFAGAVTWGNGTTGSSGVVSAANSLIGGSTNCQIGIDGVVPLTNGNYVVCSSEWYTGTAYRAGAVTWGNGTTGTAGIVSAANSLVGATRDDWVGMQKVTALPNGNYVVPNSTWHDGTLAARGAVTWGNGTTGVSGAISAANSLIGTGTNAYSAVGSDGICVLANGNYLVNSSGWSNGTTRRVGAVTWANGATGIVGPVSASNSLVGSSANDQVGRYNYVKALPNGNYVVGAPDWDNGSLADAGVVAWGNGTTGTTGFLTAANALVGASADDQLSSKGIIILTNSNYVVSSPLVDNGGIPNTGSATWGSGSGGTVGSVTAANSLVGSTANDQVGNTFEGITALTNGNYVVSTPDWDNGGLTDVGAATWGNGTTGISGTISTANSLVGTTAGDRVSVGYKGATALLNGNYVVSSPYWHSGNVVGAGASTWGNGATGTTGVVSAANSLVGSTANDNVGYAGAKALANGNYVLTSAGWDNGTVANAGAITWGNGATGTSGSISTTNSLVGNANSYLGYDDNFTLLPNGDIVMNTPFWNTASIASAGASTVVSGAGGTVGELNSCNSVIGSVAGDANGSGLFSAYNPSTATLLVGLPKENKVVAFQTVGAPTGAASQQFTSGTVANLVASGTAIKWYATPTGGTALTPATPLINGTTYYATQTVGSCECIPRLAVTVTLGPLATAKPASSLALLAFPNPLPTGNALHLEVHAPAAGAATLTVTDVLGRTVLTKQLSLPTGATEIVLSEAGQWQVGLYALRLAQGKDQQMLRIVRP